MAEMNAAWISRLLPSTLPPVAAKWDNRTGCALTMYGKSFNGDVAFDSYLIPHNGCKNHTLTLVLKIHLNQMLPQTLPQAVRLPVFEWGTPPQARMFMIRPWQAAEWAKFITNFKRECAKWTNKFWLIPPANFSKLDVKLGQQSTRPNVYCHLYVDVVSSPAGAHRTIDVINLDLQDVEGRLGIQKEDQNNGAFRSQDNRYDSLDVKGRPQSTQDDQGQWKTVTNYSTVVHEIGHALGLPHIGVTHQDPQCQLAILFDQHASVRASIPALYLNGSNSNACYGMLGPTGRGGNVMGGGTSYDDSNAAPWAQRLALHTLTKPEAWRVEREKDKVAPKPV